jgi:glycerophosphoryl diester phosphodiesterase
MTAQTTQEPSTQPTPAPNTFTTLMVKAKAHADAHHDTGRPVLSPVYTSVLDGEVDVAALHAHGIRTVVWTPDDVDTMRKLIDQYHVDGIITDDPEMLMTLLAQLRSEAGNDPAKLHALDTFESSAHRGGRADRPENTLPSFENGIDSGVSVLETDTYVTTDGVSAIWHDPYYNPHSCRRVDGQPYTMANRVYLHDLSMKQAVDTFICDKTPYAAKGKENFSGKQKNDLSLSPVAVAFAKKEHMPSPYSPTNAAQLFRFMKFYAWYYARGPGRNSPLAKQRAAYGARVRVAPETKIAPPELAKHAQDTPQQYVDALGGAIRREHMEGRAEIQSFYYPTLLLFQEQYPMLSTYYLTATPKLLYLPSMPAELKVQ